VVLLADTSASMGRLGKIEAMNQSVRDMLASFARQEGLRGPIQVAVITFGGEARLHLPLTAASGAQATWSDMQAGGGTPLGRAMQIAAELIEDQGVIPSRAFRPVVVLVSDGRPGDNWRAGLDRLAQRGRAQKADRIALAIGPDADESVLAEFVSDASKRIFRAEDAGKIQTFFRFLTMSVTARSRSAQPHEALQLGDPFAVGDA
jgi:uncharacterized protein YegL